MTKDDSRVRGFPPTLPHSSSVQAFLFWIPYKRKAPTSRATDINNSRYGALFSFESCLHCWERTHLSGKMKQVESITKMPKSRATSPFLKEVKKGVEKSVLLVPPARQSWAEVTRSPPLWATELPPQTSTRPSEDALISGCLFSPSTPHTHTHTHTWGPQLYTDQVREHLCWAPKETGAQKRAATWPRVEGVKREPKEETRKQSPGSGWPEHRPGGAAGYLVGLARCTCCTPVALARGDGDSPDRDPTA